MSLDSSRAGLLSLCGTLMGLAIIAVGLRFVTRRHYKLPVLADDWFAVFALLSYIGACICTFVAVHDKVFGYSSHDFTLEQTAAMAKTSSVSQIALDVLTNNTLAGVKLSAVFFYRRILCTNGQRAMNIATWATVTLVVLWLFVFQFLTGFQCGTHFSALWDGSYDQYCSLSFPFLYGLTISDFLLDVWILLLPIPSILTLHATLQRRLAIVAVFLIALIGLGASAARMAQYIKIELGGPAYLFHTDEDRLLTQAAYYLMLEAGAALIAVNLPPLKLSTISYEAGKMFRKARSFVELSILRHSSSSDVGRNPSAPPTRDTEGTSKPSSSQSRVEDSPYGLHQETELSFLKDPERQCQDNAKQYA
ncbi:hypothetical protein GGR56DRAFT_648003 [Xylariaceae sp. FL0804]|nr:hypothetical protein GGR56DRAFT_648003 [Xylariaceae sp. FL0804]